MYLSRVVGLGTYIPRQSRQTIIYLSRRLPARELSVFLSVSLVPHSDHNLEALVVSFRPARVSRHRRRVSPGRIPYQGESSTGQPVAPRCAALSPLRPSSLVPDRVSELLSLSSSPPFVLPLFLGGSPSLPLSDAFVFFPRRLLVVFFPLPEERRNALRLRRVYITCSPGGTKA